MSQYVSRYDIKWNIRSSVFAHGKKRIFTFLFLDSLASLNPAIMIRWFIFRWIWCNGIFNVVVIAVATGVVTAVVVVLALGGGVAIIIVVINCLVFYFVAFNMIIISSEKTFFTLFTSVGHCQ